MANLNVQTMMLFDALAKDSVPYESHKTGMLFAALDDHGIGHVHEHFAQMRAFVYEQPIVLRDSELRDLESALSTQVQSGVWIPNERHVRLNRSLRASTRG